MEQITPENIERLGPDEIFVFGSNLGGYHGGGAARLAHERFGAVWGVGAGATGRCYAIPTKDSRIVTLPLSQIERAVSVFLDHARDLMRLRFLVTAIGCGLAGYREADIAPLFGPAELIPPNVSLPAGFWKVLRAD